jgi:hypothetical protein
MGIANLEYCVGNPGNDIGSHRNPVLGLLLLLPLADPRNDWAWNRRALGEPAIYGRGIHAQLFRGWDYVVVAEKFDERLLERCWLHADIS